MREALPADKGDDRLACGEVKRRAEEAAERCLKAAGDANVSACLLRAAAAAAATVAELPAVEYPRLGDCSANEVAPNGPTAAGEGIHAGRPVSARCSGEAKVTDAER